MANKKLDQPLPVIAAIINFDMAASLKKLLPEIIKQNYDEIYVIDDCSTDKSRQIVASFSRVKLIKNEKNVGSGAARNRILDVLDHEAIIHFIDADMRLLSQNNVQIAQRIFQDPSIGVAGGLIVTPDKKQLIFNYGPRFSLYGLIGGGLQSKIANKPRLRRLFKYFVKPYPDINQKPASKDVFWVAEGNMLITLSIFREMGGFEPSLRYHEIQDLSIKIHRKNYRVRFDPRISVQHPFMKSSLQKTKQMNRAGFQLVKMYGLSFLVYKK